MLKTKINIQMQYHTVPISALVQTASTYNCNIYIECDNSRINVKNYEELKIGLVIKNKPELQFYFDGKDEKQAESRFQKIFEE